ncbi:autotransporter assembly complex protein TamA [Tateyamaria omphalii]|uniref:autotransporter assembly complex protein TamA n=1 Tax=Tateyamaria omphalii TaxID=299262 RepID=UPI001C9971FD|nr:autotransporter assembly complex family protein [Tateyamaria omphalii]MBY5931759.1 autotransporter assembly complex protein TamA [Tateyamaria omphalii]
MYRTVCQVVAVIGATFGAAGAAIALTVDVRAPGDLADELRAASLTASLPDEETAPRAIDVISAAQADYARLIGLLYDKGYFGPTISITVDGREAAGLSPVSAPPAVDSVVVTVDPGKVFTFGTVTVSPTAEGTERVFQVAPGETANVSALRTATEAGIEGWRQQGHAKAAVSEQQIIANHPAGQLNADIRLDPGPRLRLGRLNIEGESNVREKRLREIAGWPSGEVFDPDTLDQVEQRFRRTGTFASASLTEAETPNPDGTLDVTAQIADQLPRRYRFGAEYGTTDGVSVSALWLHRNIFGGAERLQIDGEISGVGGDTDGVDFRLGAQLSRPATWRTDLEAVLLAEIEQRDDPNLFSRTGRLEFSTVYFASEDREYSYGIGLQKARTRDDLGERDYTILTFPFNAKFDRRDNALNATSGYYAEASLRPFINIDGTSDGVVTSLDLRTYRKLGDRVVLAVRGLVGSVAGPSIEEAPADFLFFSGGSGTVRGQDYQSLGVELSPGVTIGGRSFLGLSGEMRVKTGDRFSVVGFYDAGYIGAESFFDGDGEWHTGFGAGVRYDTGIGPIRFDVALPGSGPGDSSGVEIYIGIGQAF